MGYFLKECLLRKINVISNNRYNVLWDCLYLIYSKKNWTFSVQKKTGENKFVLVFISCSQLNLSEFSILPLSLCLVPTHDSLRLFYPSVCPLVSWSSFLSALIRPFWEVTTLSLLDGLCGFEFRSMKKSWKKRERKNNPTISRFYWLIFKNNVVLKNCCSIGSLHAMENGFDSLNDSQNDI